MTEFAIFLPLLVLISLVPIELASMMFVKQSMRVAAYETARVATRKLGTYANGQLHGEQVLNERNISGWSIAFSPSEEALVPGDALTVTVSSAYADNALLGFVYTDAVLTDTIVMIKE